MEVWACCCLRRGKVKSLQGQAEPRSAKIGQAFSVRAVFFSVFVFYVLIWDANHQDHSNRCKPPRSLSEPRLTDSRLVAREASLTRLLPTCIKLDVDLVVWANLEY